MRLLHENPVVTLEGLLERLDFRWGTRKCTAELHFLPTHALCWVHEVWAGRESEGSEEATEVDKAIAKEALGQGFIEGRPEWGHRSRIRFVLSELGKKTYHELRSKREAIIVAKSEADSSSYT